MLLRRVIFLILTVLTLTGLCGAQNPFITHMYTADPSARVFNDTLYVYPSHDPDTATWFSMVDWHVFSTVDMKNWKDHGVALSVDDLSWASREAWAPDCEYYNGKYYFYYPVETDFFEAIWVHKYRGKYYLSYSGRNQILYAMADKPYGPFEYKGVIPDGTIKKVIPTKAGVKAIPVN